MKKVLSLTIFLVLVASIMSLTSCAGTGKDIVSGTGIVKFINLGGGFYGITGGDGKNYEPINLSQEFQEDGLRVSFEAKIRKDIVSIHMWGILVELITIEPCAT